MPFLALFSSEKNAYVFTVSVCELIFSRTMRHTEPNFSASLPRHIRHNTLNEMLCRACVRSGVPSSRELIGLFRSDGKRPDGMTLVPWRVITCPDTLAASQRALTSVNPGAAAERAALLKHTKYVCRHQSNSRFRARRHWNPGPYQQGGHVFLMWNWWMDEGCLSWP